MNYINEIFSRFDNHFSWLFLAFMLVAFLIGFFTAWLMRRYDVTRLKTENTTYGAENIRLTKANAELTDREVLVQAELRKSREDYDLLTIARKQVEHDKSNLESEIVALKGDNAASERLIRQLDEEVLALKTQLANTSVSSNEGLDAQILELQGYLDQCNATRAELEAQLSMGAPAALPAAEPTPQPVIEAPVAEVPVADDAEVDFTQEHVEGELDEFDSALSMARGALEQSGFYNDVPREELEDPDAVLAGLEDDALQAQGFASRGIAEAVVETPAFTDEEKAEFEAAFNSISIPEHDDDGDLPMPVEPPVSAPRGIEKRSKEEAIASLQGFFGERLAVATEAEKDDLKLIVGVGPFIEEKLNEIGIYTYDQIIQFDDEMIDVVTDAIEFFPGRIQRDNWVEQARVLRDSKA